MSSNGNAGNNMQELIGIKAKAIEKIIIQYLPQAELNTRVFQKTVIEAMNYSILAGGKRLRPMLMQETYRLFGGEESVVEPFMAAIEMIHTYSLVHDDLPAMDNDEYRRGRKTTHVVYGEAMAILAGDGLLNYAIETATKAFDQTTHMTRVARALQILVHKSGIYGMIGGQCADIESEEAAAADAETLEFIHICKTGALMEASMMIGAVLAGAAETQVEEVERIARETGLAFQIQDDVLDVTSTFEKLGKPIHSDEKNAKTTYVSLYGLEQARAKVQELSEQAIARFDAFDGDATFLRVLLQSLITRES